MTDVNASLSAIWTARQKIDWAWCALPIGFALVAIFAPADLRQVVETTFRAFASTLPFITFAVLAIAYLRAAGAEGVVAKAFTGNPLRMVFFAGAIGGLSPFCSCEVIPFIAALLAMGAPLSAVMAFWLASPLMDPAMFAITAGAIDFEFAIAKTIAAISIGIGGGLFVLACSRSMLFSDPLRPDGPAAKRASSCCGAKNPFDEKPVWALWREEPRRSEFAATARENALFLSKWLLLAYLLEAVMIRWVPADWIAGALGGDGIGTIFLAALLGAPAYLNGYAAAPLAAGLMEQGMSAGAAMSFLIAGGVTCIPAAVAVFSLVRIKVFAAYVGLATIGAVIAGLGFNAWIG